MPRVLPAAEVPDAAGLGRDRLERQLQTLGVTVRREEQTTLAAAADVDPEVAVQAVRAGRARIGGDPAGLAVPRGQHRLAQLALVDGDPRVLHPQVDRGIGLAAGIERADPL